jgi:hypothetical protein
MQEQAKQAIELAEKNALNNGNAHFCLRDAKRLFGEGQYFYAAKWAWRSLAHSVGIFHKDYQQVEKMLFNERSPEC